MVIRRKIAKLIEPLSRSCGLARVYVPKIALCCSIFVVGITTR